MTVENKKIVLEGVIDPRDVDVEDGGCARIFALSDSRVERFFVCLHSWSEEQFGQPLRVRAGKHPEFDSLVGKKVRVTVEVVD